MSGAGIGWKLITNEPVSDDCCWEGDDERQNAVEEGALEEREIESLAMQ
jgi:hypothetical protein